MPDLPDLLRLAAHPLFLAAALSLGLGLLPQGKYALYPFRLFTTWLHECAHAVTALLVGGEVSRITFSADASGLTEFRIPPGRLRHGLVASAGYLGSCVAGCGLYFLGVAHAERSPLVLVALGAAMLLTVLIWIRNLFGVLTALGLGAALLCAGSGRLPWGEPGSHTAFQTGLLSLLGIQAALGALLDLRTLFGLDPRTRSDAQTMKSLLWLPAGFWATLWIALSLALMGFTVRHTGLPPGLAARLPLLSRS